MVSVYDIKPRFQALLRPLTNGLAGAGVTANQVTLAAAVLSITTGAVVAALRDQPQILLLLPAVLFVRMALNAIDGMLAREHGQKSRLGAVLNELGDVVSDAGLYLPLALVPGFNPYLVVAIVVLGVISEMAGVVAIQIGASRRYDGPMGKSDRAFVLGTAAFLVGVGLRPGTWLDLLLGIVALLLVVTIVNRARKALGETALAATAEYAPPTLEPGSPHPGEGGRG
jgi:CDP-diacylglycerol--glycerol-3-phosphate 3-phosphatidyltransferase